MTGNIENYPNVDAQNLAQSYTAMQAATAHKAYDPLELELRNKRAELMREAAHNFGSLFALEGHSKAVEDQRLGTRKRLAALYTELEENPDPVPQFNGYFTKGYHKAAIALAQKPEATPEQKEEAAIIQRQNQLIAEKRFDELPKAPAPLPPEESASDVYFSSYLKDIARRQSVSQPSYKHRSQTGSNEGWFKKATNKLSSAWKSVKGWFSR